VNTLRQVILAACLLVPAQALGQAAEAEALLAPRSLSLSEALRLAHERQPTLRQARAQTDVLDARLGRARSGLFPQVEALAIYQGTTANFTQRPGATPPGAMAEDPDFDLYNFFNFGLSARQLIYDFGKTSKGARAAKARSLAQQEAERTSVAQVEEDVRVSFFQARAAKALIDVARETLDNFERHMAQIEGFVRAGARAEIDLAQARTDRANARVDLIVAENAYIAGKARLNRAIGVDTDTDYDVAEENLAPIDGEDSELDALYRRAVVGRPELAALAGEVRAQEYDVGSARGGHWPSLTVFTNLTDAGVQLDNMAWNWNAGISLAWSLWQGGAVSAQVDEASAALVGRRAELDALRQQVRLEVEQARLAVRAAKAVTEATDEAVASARDQTRLAEGRYQAGVGSGLELSDAQLALTGAAAQRVRAEYELSTARARLLRAIGR
jgi:outer membrane protein